MFANCRSFSIAFQARFSRQSRKQLHHSYQYSHLNQRLSDAELIALTCEVEENLKLTFADDQNSKRWLSRTVMPLYSTADDFMDCF